MTQNKSGSPLKVMVASTIYGFEYPISQVCTILKEYGYDVLNSHMKTIPVDPRLSNTDNCLAAVRSADIVFGILRPRYGAAPGDEYSITHLEMLEAIALNKPKWFIAHRDISVARQLLKQYMYLEDGKTANPHFKFNGIPILDDIRLIHQYNDTIRNEVKPADRVGHWVDEFYDVPDIIQCVKTQFHDLERVRNIVEQMNPQP
ncbi:DUF4062 domain-containing protein [Flavobacterium sp. MFBS3-15]|uniref:DUF4062 domain-containing protein n=1 Tax=Flavobacterium sp. MFBS3-15 TaxID=2989816 RepID=UPI002236A4D2|nr:DUF4062 domain-containing protein [Flavobacterium sp. MFBS3-15]MCW4467670.1 DUF4062 domain-containing protein [Flavobacterium sp. MFBS3-15]